ncbi:probable F-box protein At3g61730 [Ananas comosus]|uniref:Probable F-box protein At3g61730 n=1 Tax=Ananas comosus TaxID=4615 RepID=A0A6P5FUN8_ANACO|nr:probable F-box protein At3g61730 [Ananas comosus]
MGLAPSRCLFRPRAPAISGERRDSRKRERCEGDEMQHTSRKRGGGSIHRSRKRERTISSCTSPRLSFLSPHPTFNCENRYELDVWTEVARYLDGKDLIRLALVNRWFHRLIGEETIWKHVCLRDLQVPTPQHVSFPWKQIYASALDGSHSYCFRQREKHLDWMRIGSFFLDSPFVLLTETLALPKKLPQPGDDPERSIQITGTCLLTNARTGIWIADLQLVRCPVCNLNTCEGTMQVLDARHAELFLEEGYRRGSWEYEDLAFHRIEKPSTAAVGGIFDLTYLSSLSTAGVLDWKSWIGQPNDWQPKARLAIHAVAVNTNLQPNDGLHVRFQAMRNGSGDGEVVSIRISQQLI